MNVFPLWDAVDRKVGVGGRVSLGHMRAENEIENWGIVLYGIIFVRAFFSFPEALLKGKKSRGIDLFSWS